MHNPEPGTAALIVYHVRPRPTRLINGPRRPGIDVPTMERVA